MPRAFKGRTYNDPEHPLHGRPLVRRETCLLEVLCSHGVGHPIRDSVDYLDKNGPPGARGTWGVHGCDGCCSQVAA